MHGEGGLLESMHGGVRLSARGVVSSVRLLAGVIDLW